MNLPSKWYHALLYPQETFRKVKDEASLGKAILSIGLGALTAVIVGGLLLIVFWGLLYLIGSDVSQAFGEQAAAIFNMFAVALAAIAAILFIIALILAPIIYIIILLIFSGIYLLFAKLLGGRGDYTTQTYFISLCTPPLLIITTIIGSIPFVDLSYLSMLVWLYGLYPLTLALKETHGYNTGKAVLTWLIPTAIIVLALTLWIGINPTELFPT